MYLIPQMIWVAGFVLQSLPSLAIFEPGSAWGMPYAPELGLVAFTRHMLSRMMMLLKQSNWLEPNPNLLFKICRAISLGSVTPGSYPRLRNARSLAALFSAAFLAAAAR